VSLGTWSHGGPKEVGRHPVGWSGHDDRLATEALLRAWELGITHWDTADAYGDGHAEELIGALWEQVPREEIFLASKVGWDPGPYDHFYHPQQVRRQLERSLAKLRTDRIDLYYFHHCDFGADDRYLDDALEVVRAAQTAGKIRFVGLSDWQASRIVRLVDRVQPDVVQPYRNVLDDNYAGGGLQTWVETNDAGVAFFSPLKHGLLLGKYAEPVTFEKGDHRRRTPQFRDAAFLDHLRSCRDQVSRRFAPHPQPVLHALTGSLLADSPTACVLLGLRNPAQAEAAGTLGEPLSAEDAAWVKNLYQATPN
jgi:aryl-alcohol dehydrogenase-like predicted oxidoreductase